MAVAKRTSLALPVAPPYDFRRSVEYFDQFAPAAGGTARHRDAVVTGGFAPEPFVARLRADESGLVHARVEWIEEPGDGSAVAERLDSFLSLSDDLSPLYDAAASDPAFARAVADLYGYHHVRFPTPFEAACWAVLSRRTPTLTALRRKRSLAESAGRVVSVDGLRPPRRPASGDVEESPLRLFPTPERVAAASDAVRETLDDDPARAVLGAAAAFESEDLSALSSRSLVARLCEIRGFDPRSATFVARRGFGRTSLLPVRERRLRTAVADLYGLDDATDDDIVRLSDPYGDSRGYWAHYVRAWASLRGDGGGGDGGRDGDD
ncbi:DNA glycosylase family protein [Halopelagius longus]|uniref:DNA-3-methyladenine glycosylase 2 family protein n=1 Tax=Halopelagius longus TaxID=1236180 RepID=A0A1H1DIV4_9EURY|nr:hypothetical protein [Halopelagius longus]RDI71353.1 DNA-3-methyladenine glycosylase 2 family protein [Halopelagius longus]SDQ76491.1 DNA-3-methyladenine glycosylase II [Halopelagius longus]